MGLSVSLQPKYFNISSVGPRLNSLLAAPKLQKD